MYFAPLVTDICSNQTDKSWAGLGTKLPDLYTAEHAHTPLTARMAYLSGQMSLRVVVQWPIKSWSPDLKRRNITEITDCSQRRYKGS